MSDWFWMLRADLQAIADREVGTLSYVIRRACIAAVDRHKRAFAIACARRKARTGIHWRARKPAKTDRTFASAATVSGRTNSSASSCRGA